MANGYPLAAVVGRAEPMRAFERDLLLDDLLRRDGLAGRGDGDAEVLRDEPVLERHLGAGGPNCARASPTWWPAPSFDVELVGNPPRSALSFGDPRSSPRALRGLFLQECHKRGVLFGGPMFPTYSHTDADMRQTLEAAAAAFELMGEAHASGDYARYLEGPAPGTVFRSH